MVVVMLPVVLGLAHSSGVSPAHLLMPLSFASLLGGMNTLVGTSTNILVSAVAVLLTPVAITTAQAYAVSQGLASGSSEEANFVRACMLAIAYGGSLCIATPIGHQVNLMVMGPRGYRYGDFVKLGLPLSLLAWIVVSVGLALRFGS